MENLQAFPLFDTADEEDDSEKDAYDKHQLDKKWHWCGYRLYANIIPVRLILVVLTTLCFTGKYFNDQCVELDDGSSVSKNVYLPLEPGLSFMSFIFGPIPSVYPVPT